MPAAVLHVRRCEGTSFHHFWAPNGNQQLMQLCTHYYVVLHYTAVISTADSSTRHSPSAAQTAPSQYSSSQAKAHPRIGPTWCACIQDRSSLDNVVFE